MAAAPQPDAAKQLAAIQRRLERWELTHLRAHAASLAERIERLEEELERARTDADHAWRDAECWRDQVQNLIEDLNAAGRDVGMTQNGELVVMPGVDIDAVHLSQVRKAADKAMDAWADRATAALPEHYTPTLTPYALPNLKQAIADSPFVTVGEIAEACGMTAATVTAAAESLLRNALKAAGCVRAKRKASDGVVRWGYITPSALEGDCASLQTGGAA